MAGVVCTVAGGKGGVGRTTTAINLGAALEQYDYDTVVVDADLSMSDMQPMLDLDIEDGVHSVLSGEASVADASVDLPGGLTVLPGERGLDAYANADASGLRELIEALRETADVVLVDTGAGPTHETSVAIGVSDAVVLVTTPDDPAIHNAQKTIRLTERLSGEVTGALVTHVQSRDDVEKVDGMIDVPVLGAIPIDADATGDEPLMVKALDSTAAKAYSECADWFNAVVLQGRPREEVKLAFDDAWVTEGESAGERSTGRATAGRSDAEAEAAGSDDEDEDDDADGYTGGALPFG